MGEELYSRVVLFCERNNMNLKQRRVAKGRLVLIIFLTLTGIVYLASRKTETHAQNQVPKHVRVSAISDWSHHYVVYSTPSSVAQSLKLQSEPRYQLQLRKNNSTPPHRDAAAK
jgi:hypothetical protein